MNSRHRPSPEVLLQAIKQQELQSQQGALKIFLGMAAGVGKTYAMLEAAQHLHRSGIKLVVGTISTHGREETANLLGGLEVIPEKKIAYKNIILTEMDIDAILIRKPDLVLVDELAHSNAPGSRHHKRWQDVIEILTNGIDVYTTLNVQHIESLKDIIEHITGITIRETVPDSIIEAANFIELVDLTPGELLMRLKDGKVYLGDKSELAAQNFFREDRLTALREIVLRYAAEKIDHDLQSMVSTAERGSGWKTRERLLVALSHHTSSQKLIRIGRRLASNLNAPWIALHVNDGSLLDDIERKILAKNLAMAHELGAEVITTDDLSIIAGIERIARQRSVTQIILGRSPKKGLLSFLQETTMVNRLVRECPELDIHVVRQEALAAKRQFFKKPFLLGISLFPYLLVFSFVCLLAIGNWFLLPTISYEISGVIFLIGVLVSSFFFTKGPVFFASLLYAGIWDFFFISPQGEFKMAAGQDSALLLLYFITAITAGTLVDRIRLQNAMLAKRESSTRALYEIVKLIASGGLMKTSFKSIKELLAKIFHGSFEIIVKRIDNGLQTDELSQILQDEKEKNAAIWVFENNEEAGWSTETLPQSKNYYLPLKGYQEIIGVLVYHPDEPRNLFSPEESHLLHSVSRQLANYVERHFVNERTTQKEQIEQISHMQKTFLESISLALEQPLSTTKSALQSINNHIATLVKEFPDDKYPLIVEPNKRNFIANKMNDIETSTEILEKTLANISAMAKFSEGLIPINKKEHNVSDLIRECCANFNKPDDHIFKIDIAPNLPGVPLDLYLIEVLLLNLLNNAVENSPKGSTVEISARIHNGYFELSVADEGKGIPEDQIQAIFEKFYRLPNSTSAGVGLGLTIAKMITELHNGYLTAENRSTGGAKFSLLLPIDESNERL